MGSGGWELEGGWGGWRVGLGDGGRDGVLKEIY